MIIEDKASPEEQAEKYISHYKLPKGWEFVMGAKDGEAYSNRTLGLRVIVSSDVEEDGRTWLHVSVSRRNRMPEYKDVFLVKHLFIGDDKKAIQVFPPKDEHINDHPYCLHLFHCVEDSEPLPDFTRGG